MTIIKDIFAYLSDETSLNLFRSRAPAKQEDVVWLVESPSPPPNPSLGYYEQNLDFWARFRLTDSARTALESIQTIFHRKVSYDTANFHVYLSAANSLIVDMGEDIEGRKLYQLSMRFIYRERS